MKRDQWDPILALGMGEDGWDAEVGGEEWQERVKAEVVFESVAETLEFGRRLLAEARTRGDEEGMRQVGDLVEGLGIRRRLEWD